MLFKVRPQLRRQIRQLMRIWKSFAIRQASSTGPSRNASLRRSGAAADSYAAFSSPACLEQVALPPGGARINRFFLSADIGGITLRKPRNTGAEIIDYA